MNEKQSNIISEEARKSLGIPVKLWNQVKQLYDKYDIEHDESKVSAIDYYNKIFFMIAQSISDENEQNIFLEFLWYLFRNKDFISNIGLIYLDVYNGFINIIEELIKTNKNLAYEIMNAYNDATENTLAVEDVIASLLMNQQFYSKTEKLIREKSMLDFKEKAGKIFQKMLDNYDPFTFKLNMFDLIIKFGYIIESYTKEIALFMLKGYSIKNSDIQKYYWINEENKRNRLTIGRIFNEISTYEVDFKSPMSKIRNAIFHSNFVINYDAENQNRNIVFFNKRWNEEKNFKELIEQFYITCYATMTFSFAIMKFMNLEKFKKVFLKELQNIKLAFK